MTTRRSLTLAAAALGLAGLVGATRAHAGSPPPDAGARARFVALLTSVKPKVQAGAAARAKAPALPSLRAFAGFSVAATPVNRPPNRH